MPQAGGPCPGTCNARYREAREAFEAAVALYDPLDAAQSRPLSPEIRPWPGEPYWCGRCTAKIRAQLHELDEAGCLIAAEADGLRGESGEAKVKSSRDAPSPSASHDDLDELVSMLSGWENTYREMRGWPTPPRRGYLASVVTSTTAWLMAHLDGMLEAEAIAADFGAEILRWHRELCGKAKAGVRKLHKPMRCPGCHLLMLMWTEGEKYVRCANPACGRTMTLAEYEAEVAIRAGAARGGSPVT